MSSKKFRAIAKPYELVNKFCVKITDPEGQKGITVEIKHLAEGLGKATARILEDEEEKATEVPKHLTFNMKEWLTYTYVADNWAFGRITDGLNKQFDPSNFSRKRLLAIIPLQLDIAEASGMVLMVYKIIYKPRNSDNKSVTKYYTWLDEMTTGAQDRLVVTAGADRGIFDEYKNETILLNRDKEKLQEPGSFFYDLEEAIEKLQGQYSTDLVFNADTYIYERLKQQRTRRPYSGLGARLLEPHNSETMRIETVTNRVGFHTDFYTRSCLIDLNLLQCLDTECICALLEHQDEYGLTWRDGCYLFKGFGDAIEGLENRGIGSYEAICKLTSHLNLAQIYGLNSIYFTVDELYRLMCCKGKEAQQLMLDLLRSDETFVDMPDSEEFKQEGQASRLKKYLNNTEDLGRYVQVIFDIQDFLENKEKLEEIFEGLILNRDQAFETMWRPVFVFDLADMRDGGLLRGLLSDLNIIRVGISTEIKDLYTREPGSAGDYKLNREAITVVYSVHAYNYLTDRVSTELCNYNQSVGSGELFKRLAVEAKKLREAI